MPKLTKELSALEVKRLNTPGRHPVGTVPGLYLWVRETGTKNWVLRVVVGSKRTDIGLGGYPAVSLADAVKRARETREGIAQGANPIAQKKAARAATMTFKMAAEQYIELHRAGWRNAKHAQQWDNTLSTYVYPTMGQLPVKEVGTSHVLAVVRPYWNTKNETMVRVRNRIELVLSWAMASGHRERGLNPAAWRGHLDQALPKPSRVNQRKHHPALPWQDLPALMEKLKAVEGMSARCLEFTILTACRSGESRGAIWDEFDLTGKTWTIPAERMKAGRVHRVPLSDAAIKLLMALPRIDEEPLVFFGRNEKTPLSDMSLTMLLRRHAPGVTAHGFRSTFRDWAAETTDYPSEVCEMALAHAVGGSVEAAYRRGDLFAKRATLMQEWAGFATGGSRAAVVDLGGEKRA
jgi:integrase